MKLRNYDGMIAILPGTSPGELAVYKYELKEPAAEVLCEGCGRMRERDEDEDNADPEDAFGSILPFDVPAYECFAIHQIDGFGDSLTYCQDCIESGGGPPVDRTDDPEPELNVRYYSGNYGNPHTYNTMEWPPKVPDDECTAPHLDSAWEDIEHPISACGEPPPERWFCSTCNQEIPRELNQFPADPEDVKRHVGK